MKEFVLAALCAMPVPGERAMLQRVEVISPGIVMAIAVAGTAKLTYRTWEAPVFEATYLLIKDGPLGPINTPYRVRSHILPLAKLGEDVSLSICKAVS